MASPISLSNAERTRVLRMAAATLDLLSSEAAVRDGAISEKEAEQRRTQNLDKLDVALALDLADRLGEYTLRKAMEESIPPSARASADALLKRDGGVLPLIKSRIEQMRILPGATTVAQDSVGCALGAIAVVAGCAGNGVIGGVLAVGGVVMMSECC